MSEKTSETKSGKARKNRFVHVRFTDAEHQAISEAAQSADLSTSSFFRSLLLEGAGVRPIMTAEDRVIMAALLEDMRKIGINLNQVARSLNAGKTLQPTDIMGALNDVQRIQAVVMSELRMLSRRAGNQRRGEG